MKEAGKFERLAKVIKDTMASTTPFVGFRAKDKVMHKKKAEMGKMARDIPQFRTT